MKIDKRIETGDVLEVTNGVRRFRLKVAMGGDNNVYGEMTDFLAPAAQVIKSVDVLRAGGWQIVERGGVPC